MQRMTESKLISRLGSICRLATMIAVACGAVAAVSPAKAQVVQADYDYEASGFVVPQGMVPPQQSLFQPSSVMQVGYMPSGFSAPSSACDAPGCASGCSGGPGCGAENMMGCAGGPSCGAEGCDGATPGCVGGCFSGLGGAGLACGGCGRLGCGFCGGLSNLRHMCIFCRGAGCSACQLRNKGGLFGFGALGTIFNAWRSIEPYSDAGLCSQRWYDVSLGLIFLGKTNAAPGASGGVTSQGIGGPIVLSMDNVEAGQLEEGLRLSGSLMVGPGSNIEATWIGGHEWGGFAQVQDSNALLFSFISEFGAQPGGTAQGFDDTDRSLIQTLRHESDYDSIELNYRRRTVWPCCRFQGSWLAGLRYIRYDDAFDYTTTGTVNNTGGANLPRFFSSNDRITNRMFGAQVGGDFWWNINPGISYGLGLKLGAMQNDMNRIAVLTANSIGPGATAGSESLDDGEHETTIFGEFESKLIYRVSHSITFRSAYHLVAIDDVAFGGIDDAATSQFIDPTRASTTPVLFGQTAFNSLVVQGFSMEVEYMW